MEIGWQDLQVDIRITPKHFLASLAPAAMFKHRGLYQQLKDPIRGLCNSLTHGLVIFTLRGLIYIFRLHLIQLAGAKGNICFLIISGFGY